MILTCSVPSLQEEDLGIEGEVEDEDDEDDDEEGMSLSYFLSRAHVRNSC